MMHKKTREITPSKLAGETMETVTRIDGSPEIAIQDCPSCHGPHKGLAPKPYSTDGGGPFTHWYSCNRTGDPVPLALVSTPTGNHEVNQDLLTQLVAAQRVGAYMVVIVTAAPDGKGRKLELRKNTVNFPVADYEAVLRLLRQNMEEETGPPPAQEMPAAPPELPSVNLFDDGEAKG